jgi:hypothetical protein
MSQSIVRIDPYLEAQGYWRDFHTTFLNYCREAIADQLPDSYEARLDEQMNLIHREAEQLKFRTILPDVGVLRSGMSGTSADDDTATATIEPVTLTLPLIEEVRDVWIEIYHRPERELVTVLELLSPTNKSGVGREAYLAKRAAIAARPINLVELDFLLGGERLSMREPLPAGDYFVFVSRAAMRPKSEVYYWRRNAPLPVIPIPLKAPDPDIFVNLGQVFETAYVRGRYAKSIDYTKPLSA